MKLHDQENENTLNTLSYVLDLARADFFKNTENFDCVRFMNQELVLMGATSIHEIKDSLRIFNEHIFN